MNWLVRLLWRVRFRGKVRFLSPLVPKTGPRLGRVFGAAIELDLADYVQRMMYLGCFEREETNLFLRYLKPGMTVVDIGANAGYFTYLASERVGATGRVLSIEPDPVLVEKLAGTVKANSLSNVTVLNVGLGRNPGELNLYVPPASHANRAATMTPTPGWDPIPVPVQRLDTVLKESNLSSIDLLKLDVEGFEAEVLAGAEETLANRRIRAVLCEFNSYWLLENGVSPDKLWKQFEKHGFRSTKPKPVFSSNSVFNAFFELD